MLSFAGGLIRYLGYVEDYASPAPKPDSFGSTGHYWDDEGWLLPVLWEPLATPVRPKDHIKELGPLLPDKYSPIQPSTGNGNQGAYLAEVGREVYEFLIGPLGILDSGYKVEASQVDAPLARIDDAIQAIIRDDPSLDATTKEQVVKSRYGQGLFRQSIFNFESSCRLTKVSNPRLLIASHIKPWRLCEDSIERLDGANGLLLTPHVDRLFDRGFISFGDDGNVMLSRMLDHVDLDRLGLSEACANGCGVFHPKQATYLAYHRSNVFLR
ncbi:HNH endonuclease [Dyella sp. 2RAF44]|uniref:HNH endonuclease n=1 Tax=Dyella sp. 2RAF44 TaxID=3233000 RepID=UPI003F915671